MEIKEDAELGCWSAEIEINGVRVQLRLETEDETESDAAVTGSKVLNQVVSNWAIIMSTLVNDLFSIHNEEWADPVNGRPRLSEEDFLSKLTPTFVYYGCYSDDEGGESLTVMFGDSGIFGGHAIDVSWNPSCNPISPCAEIVG